MIIPGAPAVQVAEIIGQHLQVVSSEIVVVPQHLVVARPAGALDTLVTKQVEVTLGGVIDSLIHYSTRKGIAVSILVTVGWEEPEDIILFMVN